MAPFMFCRVCRINHDKGKGHKYGVKHKQHLAGFLSKSRTKIQDIRSSLQEVVELQGEGRVLIKFWCSFCELEVGENESASVRENAIQHIGSPSHFTNVKNLLLEQGAGVADSHGYCISKEELLKWQERCKAAAATTARATVELSTANNIHSDTSHYDPGSSLALGNRQTVLHIATGDVQPLSVLTIGSSQRHLPMCGRASPLLGDQRSFSTSGATEASRSSSNGWGGGALHYMDPGSRSAPANVCTETNSSKSSHDYYPETPNEILGRSRGVAATPDAQTPGAHLSATRSHFSAQCIMPPLPVAATPQHTVMAAGQALSKVVCPPLQAGEGNVHSGAPPPWIGPSDDKQLFSAPHLDMETEKTQPLSKTQQRKLAKLRPPNRVGAAWAEMRRAQLDRAARGETVPEADASWLPNFGRVWQNGSRHDTRKEFESEKRREAKRLGRPLRQSGENTLERPFLVHSNREESPREVQPYVSKRQTGEYYGSVHLVDMTSGILHEV